ncbi:hypothetical protein HMPREF9289_1953 [Finegoldia magna BVS033A4]|uniref:Putative nitroreductase TM1586 domain-containing protein n=1 Tax=Finegoldia magna BVS033A4 TaxID=866773 RepID=E1KY38_FINMA|nr:hypothetical protein HMPREF9289_1953 [Finegoldia magna BVS033A4]
MNILELMNKRHSVRKYIDEEIDSSVKKIIEEKVCEVNRESNLNIKAVFDDKEGFNSKLAKYGKFENVNNFLIMKGVGNDLSEACGYYGEKLVMKLMNLGLGSCWVALTYNKKNIKKYIEPNENLVIVIAFGIPANWGYSRKSKLPRQVSNVNEDSPQWFKDGVNCALNAPTAINQQKFMLTLEGDKVKAKARFAPSAKVDLGIVKYHFEIGSGKDHSIWL